MFQWVYTILFIKSKIGFDNRRMRTFAKNERHKTFQNINQMKQSESMSEIDEKEKWDG